MVSEQYRLYPPHPPFALLAYLHETMRHLQVQAQMQLQLQLRAHVQLQAQAKAKA